jgi:adenylate cyclase
VTRAEGGFGEDALEFIEASLSCLSALLNGTIKDLILDTVMDCYVGGSPAEEIKSGNIRPGSMLDLHGAIWFSDIRNYSVHAQNNEPAEFIRKLNAYYEAVVGAIYGHQGEVLKFIGDAVLAIFVDRDGLDGACRRALAAAQAANRALAENRIEFDHGVGLHLGRFQFGNIGSLRRMDFTVIGSEVNLASRIESQCGLNKSRLLMSEPFAEQCGQPVRTVVSTPLKGFAGEHLLYTTEDAVLG